MELQRCHNAVCNKLEQRKNDIKKCGKCMAVGYCSRGLKISNF